MEFEFDPAKDEANRFKHGLRLSFGVRIFDDPACTLLPSFSPIDGEGRCKVVGRVGRRFRMLRHRLGMTQDDFARSFGIPLANLRQYEIGRHMPPPAVRAYLKVIETEPDMVKRVVAG